ncbi:MAG: hypothetical protein LBR38_02450 [Synergistaceae bacterium]|nr:hypothetical protein [Synergistaceae bacterium]
MSLWEKWERERLQKQGIEVERKDIIIDDLPNEPSVLHQVFVAIGTLLVCLVVVYGAFVLEAVFNGRRWTDTYIVRLFAERASIRADIADQRSAPPILR